MSYLRQNEDPLAYGDDYSQSRTDEGSADKGFIGDTFKRVKSKYDQRQQGSAQNYGYSGSASTQGYYGQQGPSTGYPSTGSSAYPGGPPTQQPQQKQDFGQKLFSALHGTVHSIGSDVAGLLGTQYSGSQQRPQQGQYQQGHPQSQYQQSYSEHQQVQVPPGYGAPVQQGENQFKSFASEKAGNDVKWYVDGCSYFWAVSMALESARESIWILDWWLSPEVYLRRPPSKNEEWRLDRVLQRAAQRGVKVNIIVYKEVTQALTRELISPTLPQYLHSLLPRSTDAITSLLVRFGLEATAASMEYVERRYPLIEPTTVSSAHTKHTLEALSPNIAVFRHPDHLPDTQTTQSSLVSSFQGLKLDAAGLSKLGGDTLKGIYGMTDDVILYWAHHEKLCLIDGSIAFMGGLDLCFGRWDTNQHFIADAHPSDLSLIAVPGQDYNNARVMDFSDVAHPFQNKLDRTKSSRMGWSDIALSFHGACVDDLRHHFIDRWNFIYDEKYNVRKDVRYTRLGDAFGHSASNPPPTVPVSHQTIQSYQSGNYPPPPGSQSYTQPGWQSTSRPHTPTTLNPQPYQPGPSGSHSPGYSQQQQQFPPPPPGPPPSGQTPEFLAPPQTQEHQYQTPGSFQEQQAGYPSQHQQSYSDQPPSPSLQAPEPYVAQQPSQPQYTAYGTGNEAHGGQPGQQPYEHPSYQTPGVSSTRGFDDSQGYEGQERRYGSQASYEGEREYGDDYVGDRGLGSRFGQYKDEGRRFGQELSSFGNMVVGGLQNKAQQYSGKHLSGSYRPLSRQGSGPMKCQILRSSTKWSNGTTTEKSIQNAYIDVIEKSQHFVYIENQFFITATGDKQKPVKNLIGKALVDRIIRAARNGEKYKVIVIIPAVPAFAGDLRDDGSLGTRAIMEFQYNSINRGGNSIMEMVAQAGFNPLDYIRFYNLRNYDRIHVGRMMGQIEQQSGVNYEDARRQHDDVVGAGYAGQGEGTGLRPGSQGNQYQQYQAAAQSYPKTAAARWDTVSECYMLGGEDIRNVPWDGTPESELDAFVSEELYIHSKTLIADDRTVICGSANLNDRSQLGTHDSEIAILINDPTIVQSTMAGRPWNASRFAASLRRQLFRKHIGLLRPQDMQRPDVNFEPVGAPNAYDWGSPEDNLVTDPLSDTFLSFWNTRARTNTEIFRKAFHAVPDDLVHSWDDYKEFYEYYFRNADPQAQGKDGKKPPRFGYGHVVRDDFPGGARELKELLSRVKGTLVEMPLCFLQNEDIAKEGLTLNALTEEVYT